MLVLKCCSLYCQTKWTVQTFSSPIQFSFHFSLTQLKALDTVYTLTPPWTAVWRRPTPRGRGNRGWCTYVGSWQESSPRDPPILLFLQRRVVDPDTVATIRWWMTSPIHRLLWFSGIPKHILNTWSNCPVI